MFRFGLLPVNLPADFGTAVALLVLAALLGAAIGFERETRHRPGGVRTSAFICFGSALFTLASEVLAHAYGGDPQRIAAQIIPGIGFLGAGAIIRDRGGVVGLTSAASIFVVASIGMALGGGMVWYAVIGTIIVLAVLRGFAWLEKRLRLKTIPAQYVAFGADPAAMVGEIAALAESQRQSLSYVRTTPAGAQFAVEFGVRMAMGEQGAFLRTLRTRPLFALVCSTDGAMERGEATPERGWGPAR